MERERHTEGEEGRCYTCIHPVGLPYAANTSVPASDNEKHQGGMLHYPPPPPPALHNLNHQFLMPFPSVTHLHVVQGLMTFRMRAPALQSAHFLASTPPIVELPLLCPGLLLVPTRVGA